MEDRLVLTEGEAVLPISYMLGIDPGEKRGDYMTQRMYLALEVGFRSHLLLWLRCLRVFLVALAGSRRCRSQREHSLTRPSASANSGHTLLLTVYTNSRRNKLNAVLCAGIGILRRRAAQRHGLLRCWSGSVDRVLLGAAKTRS
jgi:hypothetical protein